MAAGICENVRMVRSVHVNIIYPTDPFAAVPGGTDTCIRDILAYAPDDIAMQMTGVSVDPASRPVGKWTAHEINGREVNCFPVMRVADLRKQQRIPLSLKFTIALIGKMAAAGTSEILQYHRIEPMLAWLFDRRPTVLFVHTNMNVIKHTQSDIRWKYVPRIYERMEGICVSRVSQLYCVRTDAVTAYRRRFPDLAGQIDFLPTWTDPVTFYPLAPGEKLKERKGLYIETGISWNASDRLLIFVGRLDHAKDPLLLLNALAIARRVAPDLKLVIVGDGVLKEKIFEEIDRLDMKNAVALLGVKTREDVARLSAYEGMPRCVVEALGSGLPAVTTNVGEIPRVIHNGTNGYIVENADPQAFAEGILSGLALCRLDGVARICVDSVRQYTPEAVLAPVYECYRRLAHSLGKSA